MKAERSKETFVSSTQAAGYDRRAMRLLGLYPQNQDGLYMQRVRVPGGRISWGQWRKIAEIARKFTPGYPIHLTTRQDIELHGVCMDDVRRVQKMLNSTGLDCTGACGDTVRNITVCPGAGICRGSLDLAPLADSVMIGLETLPFIYDLPRKFKISFSGCENSCGLPWINDLGFVARSDGGFRVIGAGSLGPPPGTGTVLLERVETEQVVPAAVAALDLFNRFGDRERRHRARLRHVRERLGDDVFVGLFRRRFAQAIRSHSQVPAGIRRPSDGLEERVRLQLPNGDIYPEQALRLADAAEEAGGSMRFDLEHGIRIYAGRRFSLPDDFKHLESLPRIVACPGTAFCANAMSDCRSLADKIRESVGVTKEDIIIGVSGCSNSCSMAAVADIGLIGRMRKRDGRPVECYKVLAGGGSGRSPELAFQIHPALPAEEVPWLVDWLVNEYRRCQAVSAHASFADFIRTERLRICEKIQSNRAGLADVEQDRPEPHRWPAPLSRQSS